MGNNSEFVARIQDLMAETLEKDWEGHLCSCFEDASTCCYGFWCCPCLACSVSANFNENFCLPLCDILSPSICAACGIPLFLPPAALSLRSSIRNRYKIKGSICNDMIISCFCVWCSWCQMHRELKKKGNAPVVVVAQQPQTVVNVQANPVMTVNQNSAPAPAPVSAPATSYYPPPSYSAK